MSGLQVSWQTWSPEDKARLERELKRQINIRDLDSPYKLARLIEPTTVQTPALEVLDQALMDAESGKHPWLIFTMPPQEGKLVAHDEPVPTPDGWRQHGDLKPGDRVYHPSGVAVRVVEVHPDGQADMRVTTSDGGSVVVHEAHEWTIYDRARGAWRTVETGELAQRKLVSGRRNVIQLPSRGVLVGDSHELPLDPYTLGVWLGDGSTTKGAITHHADDEYVIPYEISSRHVHATTGVITDYYKGLWADLKAAGVAGDKYIPDAYLFADVQSRWDLLCGLVDTDGSLDERGQMLFANVNERLAQGVAELIRSFGYRAGVHVKEPKTSTSGIVGKRPVFVVTYSPRDGMIPARLERKRRKLDASAVDRRIAIVSVERVESRPGRCITVDSPDGLYLVGRHMLPTHNSQRVSRTFPLWCQMRDPSRKVAVVSYADGLAYRWSRQDRDDIAFNLDLGLAISPKVGAGGEWELDGYRGGMIATGISGGLTGRPVDVLIIDDPLKDQKEADSVITRQTCKNFWHSVASTRLPEKSIVIIVMTRWHEDDLAGYLMETQPGDFRLINIPAQADHDPNKGETDVLGREPGEYMISTRERSEEGWEKRKRSMGERAWLALCQGRPTRVDGNIFKRHWWAQGPLKAVERSDGTWFATGVDEVAMTWDMAFKDTDGSDYVVGQVWARRGPKMWLLDEVRDRMEFTETLAAFEALTAKWPQAKVKLIEDKANGPAVISSLRKRIPGIVATNPTESKEARARSVAPFVEAGDVGIPDVVEHPFSAAFMEECAGFPNAAHDDRVDAFSQLARRWYIEMPDTNFDEDLLRELSAGLPPVIGKGEDVLPPQAWTPQDFAGDDML